MDSVQNKLIAHLECIQVALCIDEVLPPVQAIARLPNLGGLLGPGLIQQLKPVLKVEVDVRQIIRKAA